MISIKNSQSKSADKAQTRRENSIAATTSLTSTPLMQAASACACGGGCPACQNAVPANPLRENVQAIISEPGTPLASATSARFSHAFGSPSNQSSNAPQKTQNLDNSPLSISKANDQNEVDAEKTTRSVMRKLSSRSDAPPARSASLFDNVRIHHNERAAIVADATNSQALTFGNHVMFARGNYQPESVKGERILAHELAHVLQPKSSSLNALHRLPPDAPSIDPATGIDTRSFSELWTEFDHLRTQMSNKSVEAIALVPQLLSRMVTDDALKNAGDLALWLIQHDQHELAIRALDQLKDAWWIRYANKTTPVLIMGGFGLPTSPDTLVETGETQASDGNDETARKLLGVAHLMVQMTIDQIYKQAQNDEAAAKALGDAGPTVLAMGRILNKDDLSALTELRTRILNVYPALATEAHLLGDKAGEMDLVEQGHDLAEQISNEYTLADMPDSSDMSAPVGKPRPKISTSAPSSTPIVPATTNAGDNTTNTPVANATPVVVQPPEEDSIISGAPPFEGGLALALPANKYVQVKSERYAVSEVLSRASAWAQNLFGVQSSIVVAHLDTDAKVRYYAAALDEDLTDTFPSANPLQAISANVSVRLEALPNNYDIMVIHVGNGVGFWPSPSRKKGYDLVIARQNVKWPEAKNLDRSLVKEKVFGEIDALMVDEKNNLGEIARRLAQLDATAFATLNTDKRMAYLRVLLDAWTLQAQEKAVVEIMKSVTSHTELLAIIERLKAAKHWEKLINDLDNELWSLLMVVGERFGKDDLTVKDIYQAMVEAKLLSIGTPIPGLSIGPNGPEFGVDVFAEIQEAANSFVRFLEGIWDAIIMLITHPDKIIEGVAQLTKMILVFKLADMGYVPAMTMRAQILQQFGKQLSNGFKGVTVLGVGTEVLRRIKWAIIWEVASFFIGVGEIKAAMTAMGASARVGAIAKFLRLLGLAGKAVEAEEAIGGITRLAGILGRSSKVLRSEEEVLVALSHLPEDEALKLGKALEGLELKEGMTLTQLKAAHPELGELANTSLKRAEVVHQLANKAGGFSDEVARLFSRLSSGGHDTAQLEKIIGHIPEGEGPRFLKTMSMITDDAALAGEKGLATLEMLAQSTERMQAVERFGFRAVDALMEKTGRNAAETDKYLRALAAIEKEFPEASRATKMQEFVEAVANKDMDALTKLEQRVNPNAPKTPTATPPATTPAPKETPPATTPAPKETPPATTPAPKETPPATTPAPKETPPATTPAPKETPPATTPAPKETPPATTAPKEAPKPQAPADLQKLGIEAETPKILKSADFSKVQLAPGQDALYIIRDTADGSILKVGKTSESAITGRFRVYKNAERLEKRVIQIEVYPLKPNPQKAETFETALRNKMEAEGHAMPWDNTGNRLKRPGFGTPGEGIRIPGVSRERLIELLTLHKGNRKEVGKALGIHHRTVGMWAQNYGIKTTSFK